jgi:hypothetical protein
MIMANVFSGELFHQQLRVLASLSVANHPCRTQPACRPAVAVDGQGRSDCTWGRASLRRRKYTRARRSTGYRDDSRIPSRSLHTGRISSGVSHSERQLARPFIAFHEIRDVGGELFEIAAPAQLLGYGARDVPRPSRRDIEGDYPNRVLMLSHQHVREQSFEFGSSESASVQSRPQ